MALSYHSQQLPLTRNAYREIRLILGDQLNASHSWYKDDDEGRVLYVMMEMRQETDYVVHHRQKILAFFAAMRAFADALGTLHDVFYLRLDSDENQHDLSANLTWLLELTGVKKLSYQEPDEYRLESQLAQMDLPTSVQRSCVSSEHFITQRDDLVRYFPQLDSADDKSGKGLLMETFYRQIRKQTGYLMDNGKPIGGKWNFDSENRKSLSNQQSIPEPLLFKNDVCHIDTTLKNMKIRTIGNCNPSELLWPISRRQSRELLEHFIRYCLPNFGRYQDALSERGWSLFHARISFSLNIKMLSPQEVIERVIRAYEKNPDTINIAQVEGFVRQILGWREYVRLIYWHFMPDYKQTNYFNHNRKLPHYYWTGDTKMRCMQQSIRQSLDYAYAHHIQRLMVTGNFALLTGVSPDEVNAWYLGIYIDAIEWVELPNTHGMSQFADGGILASKPYVSSGNYIHKMGDHCRNCHYDIKAKTGDNSCPFNSLYWHYIDRNLAVFEGNPRMSMIINQWQQRAPDDRAAVLKQANIWLLDLNAL
ncbi:cryptochrome/photolyase family protein [Aliidiomarina halalkaliphila]|uniref:Cryptochrome/photolyase family protein n=1 Tax=Aliidiomarina halalkaliphila TaxID=2593535 RepID=A0A552WYS0_9GAMM|nr:cryptochrome/photolyase family protein [Aliidiomarina halalkaliphila]TRW47971.1 cryptochrome/photolyase family protein [Aliidiomarina halalkaliphila]